MTVRETWFVYGVVMTNAVNVALSCAVAFVRGYRRRQRQKISRGER